MARQITTKEMYTDGQGNLIAQYYDPSIDDFVPFAEQSAVRILDKDGNPISSDNGLPVQLTGRNVLLQSATGVNVSAGSTVVAIGSTIAENISGLYVLARADASHKYRVRVDHHRETASTFSKFSGDVDALPSAERLYGVSDIIKPVGYRFGILVYNESEEDHIYDVEVRSE